jgi:hypothetical protein
MLKDRVVGIEHVIRLGDSGVEAEPVTGRRDLRNVEAVRLQKSTHGRRALVRGGKVLVHLTTTTLDTPGNAAKTETLHHPGKDAGRIAGGPGR